MAEHITPAKLTFDSDGTPCSPDFEDVYHSHAGALGQARHVFMQGNGLPARWQQQDLFVILETGFGLGLNFLATWAAWRSDPQGARRLHYVSIEKFPVRQADLARALAAFPELGALREALLAAWPQPLPGMHRLEFEDGRLVLTLVFADVAAALPRLTLLADAIYLDGFSPAKNPDMWSSAVFQSLARLCAEGATLATWSVAGRVREGLEAAGLSVVRQPGFAHKKQMLTGMVRQGRPRPPALPRQAAVIGAGLAGCAIAERLCRRGWQVKLIDRHPLPAQEASGNLSGLVRPVLSRDDNILARLSRAAFLQTLRLWAALEQEGLPLLRQSRGLLHLGRDAAHEALQKALIRHAAWPEAYARYVEAEEASRIAGHPLAAGGWFFPQGSLVNPPSYCQALLQRCSSALTTALGRSVQRVESSAAGWQLLDADDHLIAVAPTVIFAPGSGAGHFPQLAGLPLQPVRGQVSYLPSGLLADLDVSVCKEGYVTPAFAGHACVGATYDTDSDAQLRISSHAENLQRLQQLLPQTVFDLQARNLHGRVGFRMVAPDRLPLIGALPDADATSAGIALSDVSRLPGLYVLSGFASRGILWSAMAAELLASVLMHEPLPLESDLIRAVDPARFLLRKLRRGL